MTLAKLQFLDGIFYLVTVTKTIVMVKRKKWQQKMIDILILQLRLKSVYEQSAIVSVIDIFYCGFPFFCEEEGNATF